MAVATALRRRKQSERAAATLYSPPETWTSKERALRKGTRPGSSRWTTAPRARKSRSQGSLRTVQAVMHNLQRGGGQGLRRHRGTGDSVFATGLAAAREDARRIARIGSI